MKALAWVELGLAACLVAFAVGVIIACCVDGWD